MTFKIKKIYLKTLSFFRARIGKEPLKAGCFFLLSFLIGCGLRVGEPSPAVPVFYPQTLSKNEVCSNLNYKKEIQDYFLNLNKPNRKHLSRVLNCLSQQALNISSIIYNDFFTREELIAVLDDDFVDLKNLKKPFKKILAPELSQEFSLFKNYIFELIDPQTELNPSALCVLSDKTPEEPSANLSNTSSKPSFEKEALFYQSDIHLTVSFLGNLEKTFSQIEKQSQSLFKKLLEDEDELDQEEVEVAQSKEGEIEYFISKRALFSSKKRFLSFIELLESDLSESFPFYSRFLREQVEFFRSDSKKSFGMENHSFYLSQSKRYPLFESLKLASDEDRLYLLDIKYLFMIIYFMEFLFQNYDRDANLIIYDGEIHLLSCLMEPFLLKFLEQELKDRFDRIEDVYGFEKIVRSNSVKNYYRPKKIIRYIFKYQDIPTPFGLKYLLFDPDDEINLSLKEVSRLLNLSFKLGLKEIQSIYPKEFE